MLKPLVAIPILASILIVGGVVTSLWLIGSASGERDRFSSLGIAPREADAFFAINTDPTSPQWIAVNDSLGAVGAKDPIREAIDQALAEVNLDWGDDILPIAGDEAFFSIPSFEDIRGTSGLVAGFRIADRDKAQEVFADLRSRAEDEGETLEEEQYEGVTIYFTATPLQDVDDFSSFDSSYSSNATAIALFDDVLAVGGSPDDLEMVIDVVQGRAPSAEENERLQEFREAQRGDFLMWGYADLASVWDMADGFATEFGGSGSDGPVPVETPESPTPQPTQVVNYTVLSFNSENSITADGSLHVTETIVVNFAGRSDGIIRRDFDSKVKYDFQNDALLSYEPVFATRNGAAQQYSISSTDDVVSLAVGDGSGNTTGENTYEIQYIVRGAVRQWMEGPDGYYEVLISPTGNGWGASIEQVTASLTVTNGTVDFALCSISDEPTDYFYLFEEIDCASDYQFGEQSVSFQAERAIQTGEGLGFSANMSGDAGAPPPDLVPAEFDFDFDFDNDSFDDGFSDGPLVDFPFDVDTEEIFEQLRGAYDRVGFSISSTSDGFALDATVLHADGFDPERAFEPTQAFDSHFADSVPSDTMFYFAGYDLYNQNWLPLSEYMEGIGLDDGETSDDLLDSFTDETGLDLEDDILSLLTGEYAFAANVINFDDPDFSILALLDIADADKAQIAVNDLGGYLEDEGEGEIEEQDGIQRWRDPGDPGMDPIGVTVTDDELIAGYPDTLVEDAVEGIDDPLSDTDEWKRTVGLLPGDTTSIGFLSVSRILEELRRVQDAHDQIRDASNGEISLDDLASIKAAGYATTSRDNGLGVHFVLYIED